jgi:predicted regulator of Ras-like GTPase activity (Roadblock/LC7/MglB family)
LKASEVERGMATGRPTVLLRAIYKQAPEFFTSEVPATDLREVALPFAKVVEQFATFQVRDDQVTDGECPQVETPFLQVTLEDNARFGTPEAPAVAQKTPALQPAPVAEAKPAAAAPAKPVVTAESKPIAVAEAKPAVVAEAKLAVATETKPTAAPESKPAAAANSQPAVAAGPKAIAPIKFSAPPPAPAPAHVAAPVPAPTPASKAAPALDLPPPSAPTAANISPNGTGGPAAERVPASSGSPVPTPLPSPLAPLPPTRIPFKITPPSSDLRAESKFPSPRANQEAGGLTGAGPCIALSLRNILRNVAPFQLTAPIDSVPESAQIEIPFSIVQPQLSLGRVAISPAQFQAALPEEHRALFKADPAGTPIPLALEDVLQNLPTESLQLRGDQEEPELADAFETPFSQKANEDAARLKVSAGPISRTAAGANAPVPEAAAPAAEAPPPPVPPTPKLAVGETPAAPLHAVAPKAPAPKPAPAPAQPVAKAVVTPSQEAPAEIAKVAPAEPPRETPELASVPKAEAAPARKPAAAPAATATGIRTSLQNLLDTDEPLDAKSVVGHVSRLPGVSACAIVFSDGLSLAGNIPADYEADALCALAPSILKRMSEQMVGAKLGALHSLTLCCGKTPLSFFAHGNICLAAIHSRGEITPEIRDRLGRTTQELARMYAEAA